MRVNATAATSSLDERSLSAGVDDIIDSIFMSLFGYEFFSTRLLVRLFKVFGLSVFWLCAVGGGRTSCRRRDRYWKWSPNGIKAVVNKYCTL